MGKDVEVSLSGNGKATIRRRFSHETIAGRSIGDLVKTMLNGEWEGEDGLAANVIKKEMQSAGNYTALIDVGEPNLPVRHEPVRLGEVVLPYVRDVGKPANEVNIELHVDHVVGYRQR